MFILLQTKSHRRIKTNGYIKNNVIWYGIAQSYIISFINMKIFRSFHMVHNNIMFIFNLFYYQYWDFSNWDLFDRFDLLQSTFLIWFFFFFSIFCRYREFVALFFSKIRDIHRIRYFRTKFFDSLKCFYFFPTAYFVNPIKSHRYGYNRGLKLLGELYSITVHIVRVRHNIW